MTQNRSTSNENDFCENSSLGRIRRNGSNPDRSLCSANSTTANDDDTFSSVADPSLNGSSLNICNGGNQARNGDLPFQQGYKDSDTPGKTATGLCAFIVPKWRRLGKSVIPQWAFRSQLLLSDILLCLFSRFEATN